MERPPKYELAEFQLFANPAEKVLAKLERTTEHFQREIHLLLRSYGLTSTQYTVLRILASGAPGGLTCSEIGNRLVSTDPDITRLLDRLASQRFVRRQRDPRDRRAVLTQITEEGQRLLASIEPSLQQRLSGLFDHMAASRLHLLAELLDETIQPSKVTGGEATVTARAG
jgi:DNA-binding MarR family transcriptional regulator